MPRATSFGSRTSTSCALPSANRFARSCRCFFSTSTSTTSTVSDDLKGCSRLDVDDDGGGGFTRLSRLTMLGSSTALSPAPLITVFMRPLCISLATLMAVFMRLPWLMVVFMRLLFMRLIARWSLPLAMIRPLSSSIGSGPRRSTSSCSSRSLPNASRRIWAHLDCWGPDRCISRERMTGSSDITNAVSAMAAATRLSRTRVVSVPPCVTSGSPSAPSQRSISMQRHPASKTRRYMPASLFPVSWLPVRYVLWELLM